METIKEGTFKEWFKANLADSAKDIASHGADCGYPYLTYNSDCVELFDKFDEEIWDWARDEASEQGCKNVMEFIAGFGRADMADTHQGLKVLMVWYATEKCARDMDSSIRED